MYKHAMFENVISELLNGSLELAMARKGGLKPASILAQETIRKRMALQSIEPTSTPQPSTVALLLGNDVVFSDGVCN